MMVLPSLVRSPSDDKTLLFAMASKPLVVSSSNKTSVSEAKADAIIALFLSPPEIVEHNFFLRSHIFTVRSAFSAAFLASSPSVPLSLEK